MQYPASETADFTKAKAKCHHDVLREEHVITSLRADKGNDATLNSWTVHSLTEAGDNYTAVLACIRVAFSQNGTKGKVGYVVKLDPRRGQHWDDFIRMSFEKEVGFYDELAPAMSRELEGLGLPSLRVPRCLLTSLRAKEEMIIQEDLRERGFVLHDRTKTMDVPHALLTLQELARLHAASQLLEDAQGLRVKHGFLSKHWSNFKPGADEIYRSVMADVLENARTVLRKVEGFGKAVDWLERLKPQVLRVFEEQTATDGPFAAVCHFDVVSNNLLFRYDQYGEPAEIRLLDFQMCYYSSVATDLTEFLLTCLSGADRKRNMDHLLRSYYVSFSEVFGAKGKAVPFTYESLWEECKVRFKYGALSAIAKIPYIMAEGKEVQDMDEYIDQEAFSSTQLKNLLIMQEEYESFDRFLSIFDDLDRFGLLD